MMQEAFYKDLSPEAAELCEEILRVAKEKQLGVAREDGFLGFGKEYGFYLFWLARKEGADYFKARRTYARKQADGMVYYELRAENREGILQAIESICRERPANYKEYRQSVQEVRESRRKAPPRTPSVNTDLLRETADRALGAWNEAGRPRTDAEELANGEEMAAEFSRLAEAQLSHLCLAESPLRRLQAWQKYVLTDECTLEDLGREFGVTRERVRQLVKQSGLRLEALFRRLCARGEGEFHERNAQMIRILDGVHDVLIGFLWAALGAWGKRKRGFMLRLLFNAAADDLLQEIDAYAVERAARNALTARVAEKGTWLEDIRYPTQIFAGARGDVRAFPLEKEYRNVARFRKKLEGMGAALRFVQKPDIVYYCTSETEHRPDFLLELPDGRRVLVLILAVLNQAFAYNRARCRALYDFCEKHGYGYLVIDPNGKTPWILEALELDPALTQALDMFLATTGRVIWSDILALRRSYEITHATIAAYVLQNDRHFTIDPYFCIYP